jgi:DNA-binding NtrC family response regulator
VRELEAVMERISVLSNNDVITVNDLPAELRNNSPETAMLFSNTSAIELPKDGIIFEELERNFLLQALRRSNGIMAEAAKLLGMTYRTFQYRAEKFGIKEN